MIIFEIMLLLLLVICSISVSLTKDVLSSIIIFMSYGVFLSITWLILESPDLALTEAAVGVGITSILFLLAMKKMNAIDREQESEKDEV